MAGAGAVARDDKGSVLFAACSPLSSCDDAEEDEARAVKVILEMDCSSSVIALHSTCQDRSRYWTIYQEPKQAITKLQERVIIHSKHESSRVAEYLAKHANLYYGFRVMLLTSAFPPIVGPDHRWASRHWAEPGQHVRRKSIFLIKQNFTKRLFKLSISICKLSISPTILANQLSLSISSN
jgi:hypothetical protein